MMRFQKLTELPGTTKRPSSKKLGNQEFVYKNQEVTIRIVFNYSKVFLIVLPYEGMAPIKNLPRSMVSSGIQPAK